MTRSRHFFASSPWIATGTPDYVNLGYTSRGLAKQALMRLSPKSLAIFRKLGLVVGTGTGALPVMDEVKLEPKRRRIELLILPTSRAIEVLKRESADTNPILHLTC
jgi:hypothetical protein